MTEYIERTAALNAARRAFDDQECDCEVMPDVFASLQEAPTADVVEVVRCRECVHYREHRTRRHKQLMRECVRMARHDMEYPVKSDDFCSYGQRKEAGQSDAHAPH